VSLDDGGCGIPQAFIAMDEYGPGNAKPFGDMNLRKWMQLQYGALRKLSSSFMSTRIFATRSQA
jgi:hypothetical protein